jgi:hypothetical protein
MDAYKFVDFLMIRAGPNHYGGAPFRPPAAKAET